MQASSLFSLLRQARCMMEVLSLSEGVPAGCRGRVSERRNRYYVFMCVTPSSSRPSLRTHVTRVTRMHHGIKTPPGDGRSARSALQPSARMELPASSTSERARTQPPPRSVMRSLTIEGLHSTRGRRQPVCACRGASFLQNSHLRARSRARARRRGIRKYLPYISPRICIFHGIPLYPDMDIANSFVQLRDVGRGAGCHSTEFCVLSLS